MKKNRILLLLFFVFLKASALFSQDTGLYQPVNSIYTNESLQFEHPGLFRTLKHTPADIFQTFATPFKKKNWIPLTGIAAGTALLVWCDQPVTNWVKKQSLNIGLYPDTKYHDIVKIGKTRILKVPQSLNTALYQLGEGGTSMVLAGGLWIYGRIEKDDRAQQTAYDLTETFISMGISTQILKRISGRESPFKATASGGKWRPFPSFSTYQHHTSSYDAFPSGHLATMMATVTVLRSNYPEKKWITPVGYTLIGLTGWAMINTEVHWLSDYPLALAVGYVSGKLTTARHKKNRKDYSGSVTL